MLCPFCLQNTSQSNCHNCKEPLPPLYVQRQASFAARKPAILSAVGFSGHGKTVYMASLLFMMNSRLPQVWKRFYRQGLDVDTVRTVQKNLILLQEGNLPESTRRNFPRPSVHLLAEIPQYGSRSLLIYDPPGEAFDTDADIESYAHFVSRAPMVLFLVSVVDLQTPKDEDLFRLLNTYVLGMARLKAKTKAQHLVVAFTKADLLAETLEKYPTVFRHLTHADHSCLSEPKKYIETLEKVSGELAKFTEKELGGVNFCRLAGNEFKSVAYCAVSALGNAPENGRLATVIEPRCVADPLIWLLKQS